MGAKTITMKDTIDGITKLGSKSVITAVVGIIGLIIVAFIIMGGGQQTIGNVDQSNTQTGENNQNTNSISF